MNDNVQRIFRANEKTAEERATERALREQIQKEKPSIEDLVRSGDCDPDAITTMGTYFDIQNVLRTLKRAREHRGMSVSEAAARSGLESAVIRGLENGIYDNPTVATLVRYAAAVGKRLSLCRDGDEKPTTTLQQTSNAK